VNLARVNGQVDPAKYFPIADAGVQIIYFEHETSD
jgi:hypothetical protein